MSRMSGAIPPFPQYASSAQLKKAQEQLYLYLSLNLDPETGYRDWDFCCFLELLQANSEVETLSRLLAFRSKSF